MRLLLVATIAITLAGCRSGSQAAREPAGGDDGVDVAQELDAGAPRAKGDPMYTGAIDAGSPADCIDHRLKGCREDDCVAEAMDQGATEREAQSECEMYCVCGL